MSRIFTSVKNVDVPVLGRLAVPALLIVLALIASAAVAAVPESSPWVGLGGGKSGDYLWAVKAKRPDGPAGAGPSGARRPCLVVGTLWQVSRFSYHRNKNKQCVDPDASLAPREAPLVASGAQPSNGGRTELTAVGMIFAPTARRVLVTLCGGKQETIRLHELAASQASSAELGRFSYAAFAVHGEWCAERLVSEGASGRVLWDSATEPQPPARP